MFQIQNHPKSNVQAVSNQKEIQAVDRENDDDACTCNLRSIIIHRTDVDNEKGT